MTAQTDLYNKAIDYLKGEGYEIYGQHKDDGAGYYEVFTVKGTRPEFIELFVTPEGMKNDAAVEEGIATLKDKANKVKELFLELPPQHQDNPVELTVMEVKEDEHGHVMLSQLMDPIYIDC